MLGELHTLKNERERIRIEGSHKGSIINDWIGGILMLTRSLGDFDLVEKGLISTPYINQ